MALQRSRRLDKAFFDQLLNYYRMVLEKYSDHNCANCSNGSLFSFYSKDTVDHEDAELLHHMRGITEADEHMSRLVQAFDNPSFDISKSCYALSGLDEPSNSPNLVLPTELLGQI